MALRYRSNQEKAKEAARERHEMSATSRDLQVYLTRLRPGREHEISRDQYARIKRLDCQR